MAPGEIGKVRMCHQRAVDLAPGGPAMQISHRVPKALLVGLIVALATVAGVNAAPLLDQLPPDPQPLPPTGVAWRDNIYYGAVPPGGEESPTLVFVHGYGSAAEDWWGPTKDDRVNDMYLTAYETGYRTAFVSLSTEKRPGHSMWENGAVLRLQLEVIARHYGADQLDIVAHSKGGVDAQAAVAFFGGWQLVSRVFTLGSPHQGSELADLAYTSWAWPLAEVLGLHDEGVRTLQTGYMGLFRAFMDPRAQEQDVRYFSGAGTDIGPQGSGIRLMGRYLAHNFGPNDGVVTVTSTELPGAETLFIAPYHHLNIHMGSTAFPWIDAVLRSERGAGSWVEETCRPGQRSAPDYGTRPASMQSNVILRGGRLTGAGVETVPIEPRARTATFDLLVSEPEVVATLSDPWKRLYPPRIVAGNPDSLWGSAHRRVWTISQPQAGKWAVQIDGPPGTAYLLITALDSPLQVILHGLSERATAPGAALALSAHAEELPAPRGSERPRLNGPYRFSAGIGGTARSGDRPTVLQMQTLLTRSQLQPSGESNAVETSQPGPRVLQAIRREGLYTLSVSVTGQTAERMGFERSFFSSLAAVTPGRLRDQLAPAGAYPAEGLLDSLSAPLFER
jgi:pimeloyl-ACP methyl ester carboxylesterase